MGFCPGAWEPGVSGDLILSAFICRINTGTYQWQIFRVSPPYIKIKGDNDHEGGCYSPPPVSTLLDGEVFSDPFPNSAPHQKYACVHQVFIYFFLKADRACSHKSKCALFSCVHGSQLDLTFPLLYTSK